MLLAVLVFSRSSHTVTNLANIVNVDIAQVFSSIGNLSFLRIDNNTHQISFTSELFRKYVVAKLKYFEKQVYKLLIDNLLNQEENNETRNIMVPKN